MTTTERPSSLGTPNQPDDIQPRELDPTHFGLKAGEPWPDDVPLDQDDTWWRYQDDPRGARRAELKIAACWTVTLMAAIGLATVYCLGGQAQAEGALLFFGFGGLGVGLILWARDLLPGHEVTGSRGYHHTSPESTRAAVVESLNRLSEPIGRRPFVGKMLLGVGGVFGLAAFFPIASLGPRPHRSLYSSGWTHGSRVVTSDGTPIKPADLQVNSILTVFPEGGVDLPQAATIILNIGSAPFVVKKGREGWTVDGIVAFSKICTHAGCPVGLYNVETHQLVCPCHQSTFDVLEDCKPVFGPASRSLPQLALYVDSDGNLRAQGDYDQPVGPGFWNRG